MSEQFSRTALLLGEAAIERLAAARVAVFGLGGVGGYAVEALARSGVGAMDLIDHDRVSLSNLNRQIYATHKTIGQYKTDVAAERIRDINPDAAVRVYRTFFTLETAGQFDFSAYDYVVDAIDTVTGKIALVENAQRAGTPIISSMGAGNKLDPTAFEVADIYDTSVCPLAKVMRRELKRRGIQKLKVVYSKEPPLTPVRDENDSSKDASIRTPGAKNSGCNDDIGSSAADTASSRIAISMPAAENPTGRRQVPGSAAFVPSVAGLILAGEVIKDLAGIKPRSS